MIISASPRRSRAPTATQSFPPIVLTFKSDMRALLQTAVATFHLALPTWHLELELRQRPMTLINLPIIKRRMILRCIQCPRVDGNPLSFLLQETPSSASGASTATASSPSTASPAATGSTRTSTTRATPRGSAPAAPRRTRRRGPSARPARGTTAARPPSRTSCATSAAPWRPSSARTT